jgi:hydroxymethylpyrimidine/phosphomethylpyrimidine kinase
MDFIRIHNTFHRKATYKIKAVKIGIVPSLFYLGTIVTLIKQLSNNSNCMGYCCEILYYIWFFRNKNYESLQLILSEIDLITPNYNEIIKLSKETDPESMPKYYQNIVLF